MQPATNLLAKYKGLLILALLLLVGWGAWLLYQSMHFRIVGTDPATNKVSVIAPYLKIHFNRELTESGLNVSAEPNIIESYKVSGKTIDILLTQNLEADKEYTVTIASVTSTNGETLTNQVLRFTAKDIPFEDLPEEQQKAVVNAQSRFTEVQSDPILEHIPYGTLNFRLSPLFENDKDGNQILILEADILLSAADVRIDKAAAVNQYKAELRAYIRSLDLDPAKYQIRYNIIEPTL